MAVTNISQTLALAVAPLDAPGIPLLLQALDGQPVQSAFIAQSPLFVCTANISAGGDSVAFAFPGATIAGLNLASGETRSLTAAVRVSGVAAACATGKIDFTVCNIGGTLTITNTVAATLYGVSGASASMTLAATVNASALLLTFVSGTSSVGPNAICELYLNGTKGKTT